MTCIVALKKEGKVYIGADRYQGDGYTYGISAHPKIFRKQGYIIANCGNIRDSNLLRFCFDLVYDNIMDPFEFMVTEFIPAYRGLLEVSGSARKIDEQEHHDTSLLIGISGRMFTVETNFQVTECSGDYIAEGSGTYVALGALGALTQVEGLTAKEIIEAAMEITVSHVSTVRGPFDIGYI